MITKTHMMKRNRAITVAAYTADEAFQAELDRQFVHGTTEARYSNGAKYDPKTKAAAARKYKADRIMWVSFERLRAASK